MGVDNEEKTEILSYPNKYYFMERGSKFMKYKTPWLELTVPVASSTKQILVVCNTLK